MAQGTDLTEFVRKCVRNLLGTIDRCLATVENEASGCTMLLL